MVRGVVASLMLLMARPTSRFMMMMVTNSRKKKKTSSATPEWRNPSTMTTFHFFDIFVLEILYIKYIFENWDWLCWLGLELVCQPSPIAGQLYWGHKYSSASSGWGLYSLKAMSHSSYLPVAGLLTGLFHQSRQCHMHQFWQSQRQRQVSKRSLLEKIWRISLNLTDDAIAKLYVM